MRSYCIYTDSLVEDKKLNEEHIIPLSLGGHNKFVIKVNKFTNAELGNKVDGQLDKDYLINAIRRRKGYKGHSRKEPYFIVKNAKVKETNQPVQIIFKESTSEIYCPIRRRILTKKETKGLNFKFKFSYNRTARIRFTAKVVLSTGYFLYKELFEKFSDHDSIRKIMNWDVYDKKGDIVNLPVGLMDCFTKLPKKALKWDRVFESICKAIDCSCVIFVICDGSIIGAVGIGGIYMGAINFKAQTEHFGYDEEKFDGIIIAIQNNKVIRKSFYEVLNRIYNK